MVSPEHVYARVLQDATAQAHADQWRARAEVFEVAKPVVGEFRGNATNAEMSRAWNRCDAIARACRNHADLLEVLSDLDREMESRLPPADELAVAVLIWEQAQMSRALREVA